MSTDIVARLVAVGLVAVLFGYPFIRGIIDWRGGRRRLGAFGIAVGLIVAALASVPFAANRVSITLPAR
jgi:threonine/homoserine efflux transporter RhtA